MLQQSADMEYTTGTAGEAVSADLANAAGPQQAASQALVVAAEAEPKRKKKRSAISAERNRIMAKQNRERKKREMFDLELRVTGLEGVYCNTLP